MRSVLKGSTSQSEYLLARDSAGAPVTGLAYNTGGLLASYTRNAAARTGITLVTQTASGAWTSGGFAEVDATNLPGLYRLDVPNAAYATGVDQVVVSLQGATVSHCAKQVNLIGVNLQDAVRMGLTALPNVAFNGIGGLSSSVQETGTAQAGATGSITLRSGASATDNFYKSQVVIILSGTGAGQRPTFISGYTGSSKVATVSPNFVVTPDNTSVYLVCNYGVDLVTDTSIAAAVWNELVSGHTTAGTYGAIFQPIRTGTAQAGAAGTLTLDASASAVTDFYKQAAVRIISGTGAPQVRAISAYNGTTKVATITPNWTVTPDNTSVFVILNGVEVPGASAPTAATVAAAVWDELASGHTVNNSFGQILQPVRTATAQAAASSTITLDASANSSNDFYKNTLIRIVSGTGAGQPRAISSYNGTTKVATVDRAWEVTPDATSVFVIVNCAATALHGVGMDAMLDRDLSKPTGVVTGAWSLRKIIQWLGALSLWKITETSSVQSLRNEADSADLSTSQQADNGTTYTKSPWV